MDGYQQAKQRQLELQIRQEQLRQLQIQNAANNRALQALPAPPQRTHQEAIEAARNLAKAKHLHPKLFDDQYRGMTSEQRRDVEELLELAKVNNLYSPPTSSSSSTMPSKGITNSTIGAGRPIHPSSNNFASQPRPSSFRSIVDAKVLASPNLMAEVIAEIPHGTQLNVRTQERMWLQIELPNGQQGYLFKQDVEVVTP